MSPSSPVQPAAAVAPHAPHASVASDAPDPSPVRRAVLRGALVLVAWTAFGLLLAEQTALQFRLRGETRSTWSLLAPALSASWLWAAYTPLVVWATRRLRHLRERGWTGWIRCIAAHAALSATITLTAVTVFTWLRPFIRARAGVAAGASPRRRAACTRPTATTR